MGGTGKWEGQGNDGDGRDREMRGREGQGEGKTEGKDRAGERMSSCGHRRHWWVAGARRRWWWWCWALVAVGEWWVLGRRPLRGLSMGVVGPRGRWSLCRGSWR
jgi:hypothetical protein